MLLMICIYLLAGILIADRGGHPNGKATRFQIAIEIVLFWPFVVGVIYIDIIDNVKKNRGM